MFVPVEVKKRGCQKPPVHPEVGSFVDPWGANLHS